VFKPAALSETDPILGKLRERGDKKRRKQRYFSQMRGEGDSRVDNGLFLSYDQDGAQT